MIKYNSNSLDYQNQLENSFRLPKDNFQTEKTTEIDELQTRLESLKILKERLRQTKSEKKQSNDFFLLIKRFF